MYVLNTMLVVIIIPASITMTLSESMTVGIRWAMLTTVDSLNSSLIMACITTSVCVSTDAVASSKNNILLCFKRARPKHNNCLCPTLQLPPASVTVKPHFKIQQSSKKFLICIRNRVNILSYASLICLNEMLIDHL